MKTCSKCKQELPLAAFRIRSQAGYRSEAAKRQAWCRKCEKHYYRHGAPNVKWTRLAWNLRRHEQGNVTATELRTVLGEPEICYLCGQPLDWNAAELDHVLPLSQGGATEIENLRWAHRRCNRLKHDMTVEQLLAHLEVVRAHWAKKPA